MFFMINLTPCYFLMIKGLATRNEASCGAERVEQMENPASAPPELELNPINNSTKVDLVWN